MHSISFQTCCPLTNYGQSIAINPEILQNYATPATGIMNANGIFFSNLNSNNPNSQQISRPITSQTFNQADTPVQTPNVNNVLDFNANYSPFNPPLSPQLQSPEKQQSPALQSFPPQSPPPQSFPQQSFGLAFAPLDSSSDSPSETTNPTDSNSNHIYQVRPKPKPKPKPKPSSSPSPSSSSSSQNNKTPTKKFPTRCGYSKYTNSRIVGGVFTQIGEL